MINPNTLKNLFKPYQLHFMDINDLLDVTGLSFKRLLKIHVEDECSKSIDESCINIECDYNFIDMHDDELYCEVAKEIQDERKKVEDKLKEDFRKYYGKEYVP